MEIRPKLIANGSSNMYYMDVNGKMMKFSKSFAWVVSMQKLQVMQNAKNTKVNKRCQRVPKVKCKKLSLLVKKMPMVNLVT